MNQEQYAMRMENNVDDKLLILDFIENKTDQNYNILDFGCGSGSIYKHLYTSYPNTQVVGFDKSDFMIKRAIENHPAGIFLSEFKDLNGFTQEQGDFEYIILNSILHEVYSYEDGFESVVDIIDKLSKYLTKTGELIVRDGILDIDSVGSIETIEKYKLRNPAEAKDFLKKYTSLSPFPNHLKIENNMIVGTWYEVREFLNKYTWGPDSLYREAKEIVNFASLEMYRKVFSMAGFHISRSKLVCQEEYFKYLDKVVDIGSRRWNSKIVFSASREK